MKIGLKLWKFYYNLKLKVKLKEKSYIRINIRELDRVPSTKYLSYIYWANGPYYPSEHILFVRSILLQTQVFSIGQVDEPYIGVNTREPNKELYTG